MLLPWDFIYFGNILLNVRRLSAIAQAPYLSNKVIKEMLCSLVALLVPCGGILLMEATEFFRLYHHISIL